MKTLIVLSIGFTMVFLKETYCKQVEQICTGDVVLSSQAEVDAFNCTEITGSLTISGTGITNLNGLASLQKVSGDLRIGETNITTLDGPPVLEFVGGRLEISSMVLTTIKGFASLRTVGTLQIIQNNNLTELEGFSSLTEVGGDLSIQLNHALIEIKGFAALHSINTSIDPTGGELFISNNMNLTNIGGFGSLASAVSIQIQNNPALLDITGFNSLVTLINSDFTIGGLLISDNNALTNIHGFYALATAGWITISRNNQLSNLDGFAAAKKTGSLTIEDNRSLKSINGFNTLVTIADSFSSLRDVEFTISGNLSLESFQGLSSLEEISGNHGVVIKIINNPALKNIDGLSSLSRIKGAAFRSLHIETNLLLENIDGLSNIAPGDLNVPLRISVIRNESLMRCEGLLPYFESLGKDEVLRLKDLGIINVSDNGAECIIGEFLNGGPIAITCDENIVLFSQAKVDALNCTEIKGNVTISGRDITNLSSLSNLTTIGGELTITNNPLLTTLEGLRHLRKITGGLAISNNPQLTTLDGLSALDTIGGGLAITDNLALSNLDELSSLRTVSNTLPLTISRNNSLTSISGLNNLMRSGPIDIGNNPRLCSITGFNSLLTTGTFVHDAPGTLLIHENEKLTTIEGFSGLRRIADFRIVNNPALSTIGGFQSLMSVFGYLEISDNESLRTINGFETLSGISSSVYKIYPNTGLLIRNNSALEAIAGFSSLRSISGDRASLDIVNNPSLKNIDGLSSLTTVNGLFSGALAINGNARLENVEGLSALRSQQSLQPLRFSVARNPSLTRCNGLLPYFASLGFQEVHRQVDQGIIEVTDNGAGCTVNDIINNGPGEQVCEGDVMLTSQAEVDAFSCVEVTGELIISGNDITNLHRLSFLKKIGGALRIRNNPLLTDINGLSNLSQIGFGFDNSLQISNNDKLRHLDGFHSLTTVDGSIIIEKNPSLESINGFSSIVEHHGDITIFQNDALKSVDGFQKLTSIFSRTFFDEASLSFNVGENKSLASINGFSSLTKFDGVNGGAYIQIFNNPALKDFKGLSSIATIRSPLHHPRGIIIINNATLENIDGLSGLRHTPDSGPLLLTITNNPLLNDCCGLSQYISSGGGNITYSGNGPGCPQTGGVCSPPICTGHIRVSSQSEVDAFTCTAVGSLTISGNDITNLRALSSLKKVIVNLTIENNPNLKTLEGLSGLDTIGEILQIRNNPVLSDILAFSSLKSVGSDLIIDNSAITTLNAFSSLTEINGLLQIANNSNLLDIGGFTSVRSVFALTIAHNKNLNKISGFSNLSATGALAIVNNSSLSSINGFNSLTAIASPPGGDLLIQQNDILNNINGFSALARVNNITIDRNNRLTNLDGFPSLRSVLTSIVLSDNPVLSTINMFAHIDSIRGNLWILNNDKLTNLHAFSSLTGLGISLRVEGNDSLTNLDGLSSLTEELNELEPEEPLHVRVMQNPSLSSCCGLQPLLAHLDTLYDIDNLVATGRIHISQNAAGCTVQDILTCGSQRIKDFSLRDPQTNSLIQDFIGEITVELSDPRFSNLMVQANTAPKHVGSVEFIFDGKLRHTENRFPYQFTLPALTPGIHTLTAEVYSIAHKQGDHGIGLTATITVTNSAAVTGFDVVDTSGKLITDLQDGDKINIDDPAFKSFSIRANTVPDQVSNVKFWVNHRYFRTENVPPYALNGDINGAYSPWDAKPGDYTLLAVPYITTGGKEHKGIPLKIHFSVEKENTLTVASFDVVDASGKLLMHLNDGAQITIGDPVFKAVNIVANTNGPVGSVSFWLNDQYVRTENVTPYTLAGDQNGIFNTWELQNGHYNISAMPYSEPQASGFSGKKLSIHFKVVEEQNPQARVFYGPAPDLKANVSLYPVPAGNSLHVKINNIEQKEVSIIIRNIHGLTVYHGPYLDSRGIDTSPLQAGVYFLQVTGNGGFQKVVKFIKD